MASLQTAEEIESRQHCCRSGQDFGRNRGAPWLRVPAVAAQETLPATIRRRRVAQHKAEFAEMPAYFALPSQPPKKGRLVRTPGDERHKRGQVPLVPTAAHIFLPFLRAAPRDRFFRNSGRGISNCFCSYICGAPVRSGLRSMCVVPAMGREMNSKSGLGATVS
jgi:hypothetical protein